MRAVPRVSINVKFFRKKSQNQSSFALIWSENLQATERTKSCSKILLCKNVKTGCWNLATSRKTLWDDGLPDSNSISRKILPLPHSFPLDSPHRRRCSSRRGKCTTACSRKHRKRARKWKQNKDRFLGRSANSATQKLREIEFWRIQSQKLLF